MTKTAKIRGGAQGAAGAAAPAAARAPPAAAPAASAPSPALKLVFKMAGQETITVKTPKAGSGKGGSAKPRSGQKRKRRSGPKAKTPAQISEERQLLWTSLGRLHDVLASKDPNRWFSTPVTDDIAPQYSVMIKEPMDLGTMKTKIDRKQYASIEQYEHDFELVCQNCMTYNGPDTVFHVEAQKLLKQGSRLVEREKNTLRRDIMRLEKSRLQAAASATSTSASRSSTPARKKTRLEVEQAVLQSMLLMPSDEEVLAHAKARQKLARRQLRLKQPRGSVGHVTFGDTNLRFTVLDSETKRREDVLELPASCGRFSGVFPNPKQLDVGSLLTAQFKSYNYRVVAYAAARAPMTADKEAQFKAYGDEKVEAYVRSIQAYAQGFGESPSTQQTAEALVRHVTMGGLEETREEMPYTGPESAEQAHEAKVKETQRTYQKRFNTTSQWIVKMSDALGERQRKASKPMPPSQEETDLARAIIQNLKTLTGLQRYGEGQAVPGLPDQPASAPQAKAAASAASAAAPAQSASASAAASGGASAVSAPAAAARAGGTPAAAAVGASPAAATAAAPTPAAAAGAAAVNQAPPVSAGAAAAGTVAAGGAGVEAAAAAAPAEPQQAGAGEKAGSMDTAQDTAPTDAKATVPSTAATATTEADPAAGTEKKATPSTAPAAPAAPASATEAAVNPALAPATAASSEAAAQPAAEPEAAQAASPTGGAHIFSSPGKSPLAAPAAPSTQPASSAAPATSAAAPTPTAMDTGPEPPKA